MQTHIIKFNNAKQCTYTCTREENVTTSEVDLMDIKAVTTTATTTTTTSTTSKTTASTTNNLDVTLPSK